MGRESAPCNKIMRKVIHICLFVLLSVASCQRQSLTEPVHESYGNAIPVRISIPGIVLTRSSEGSSQNESDVTDVKLVVYRMLDGELLLDSYYDFGSSAEGTVYFYSDRPADSYRFVAYGNHGSLDFSEPDCDWTFFSDEVPGSFSMSGYADRVPEALELDPNVHIELRRQVSKVSLKKISLDWHNSANYAKEFKVTAVYLTDVPGAKDILFPVSDGVAVEWWNRNGYVPGVKDDLVHCDVVDGKIGLGESLGLDGFSFYSYLSSSQVFNDDELWVEGGTRLVIEAVHGSRVVYYPVPICQTEGEDTRNKHYVFEEIIIKRPGASSPYGAYPEENPVVVSCSVQEWRVVDRGTVIIS